MTTVEKIDNIVKTIAVTVTAVIITIVVYVSFNTREATVYLKCPYSSYTVVSQEIKDRSYSILKLDKKNDSDVFAGADGLFYSAKYVSEDIIDIVAIGYEDSNDTRIFKIRLKEE